MTTEDLRFYSVTDKYIDFLFEYDKKVARQKGYKGERNYCGTVLKIGFLNYFVPFTSYKADKEEQMNRRNRIVLKIHELDNLDNQLGYLLFNNMIPVPESELIPIIIDLNSELTTPKDRMLLKQYLFIKEEENTDRILNKAELVYRKQTEGRDGYYQNWCCNFKKLELCCTSYHDSIAVPLEEKV